MENSNLEASNTSFVSNRMVDLDKWMRWYSFQLT